MEKLIFAFIFIIVGINSYAQEGNKMNVLQKQPVFEIKLEGFGTQHVIEINGVIIFTQYNSAGKITTRLPVNHYMRSGDNVISLSTWPDDDNITPHAYVNVTLIVSDHNAPEKEWVIATLNYNNTEETQTLKTQKSSLPGHYSAEKGFVADNNGDVKVEGITFQKIDNVFEYSRKLSIPSSLPLWAFFESDDLPNYISMSDEKYDKSINDLLIEYMKVQNAIAENKVEDILPMFTERNQELDAAFYNERGTLEYKLKGALVEAGNDSTAELVELHSSSLNIYGSRNNKLAALKRGGYTEAISLNYKNGMGSYSFDMIFRRQDGKWILTR